MIKIMIHKQPEESVFGSVGQPLTLRDCFKLSFCRFLSSFEPIFESFREGCINFRILPSRKESKIGQNNLKKRRSLSLKQSLSPPPSPNLFKLGCFGNQQSLAQIQGAFLSKFRFFRLFVYSLFCMLTLCSASFAQDVEGFWKRINSKTGNTQCVISIYKHQDKYYGRIIGTFDADGKMKENLYAPEDRAEKVSGSPYYCGMDLLWDLQGNGTKYRGKIVDPRSGKIYNAAIWNKDGNLIVRGELFFLGKNEIWYPIEDDDFPKEFKKPDLTQFIPVIPEKFFGL